MNALAVLANLVFPGIGLVLVGRRLAGLLFAVTFCVAVDGILLSPLLIGGKPAAGFVQASALLAATVWLWSLVRLALRLRYLRSPAFLEHKEQAFKEGIELYLKDRLPEARDAFTRVLALDSTDADAQLYLGIIYRNLNQRARAKATLKRCARYDYQRKWRWEVEEQLKQIKKGIA
jgi:tetratricopeptide (TPR) repeat protein